MEIKLSEEPKGVTIVQGFPGFGMVGSISTEFLIQHLKTRQIGTVFIKDLQPILAIHEGKIVPPIGIHYNEENNLIILNFMTKGQEIEWKLADIICELANRFEAKEIIAIEGVTGKTDTDQNIYTFSPNMEKQKYLESLDFKNLNEGIVMGVSAALMLNPDKLNCDLTAFFSMTASTLPDSNASAEIIKSLDKYLKLNVDFKPLLEQAKEFEEKIKGIMSKSQEAMSEKEKSMLNYVS